VIDDTLRGDDVELTARSSRPARDRVGAAERIRGEGITAWAARVLEEQAMPREEVTAILSTLDRRLIHQYLALHVERLEEALAAERRTIERIESLLTAEAGASDDAWA
jgi:hypothetical protein